MLGDVGIDDSIALCYCPVDILGSGIQLYRVSIGALNVITVEAYSLGRHHAN